MGRRRSSKEELSRISAGVDSCSYDPPGCRNVLPLVDEDRIARQQLVGISLEQLPRDGLLEEEGFGNSLGGGKALANCLGPLERDSGNPITDEVVQFGVHYSALVLHHRHSSPPLNSTISGSTTIQYGEV